MFISTHKFYLRHFESLEKPVSDLRDIIDKLIGEINDRIIQNGLKVTDEFQYKYERFFYYCFSHEISEYVAVNSQADYLYNFLIYCFNNFLSEELGDKILDTNNGESNNLYYSDGLTALIYNEKCNVVKSQHIDGLLNKHILFGGRVFDEKEFNIQLRVEDCKLVEGNLQNTKLLFKYSIYIDKDMKGKVYIMNNT